MSAVSALGEVNSPGTPPPPLRLPRTDIFGHRARRFAELAPGHPLESYLVFMMALAEGQQHLAEAEELFAAADHELSLRLYCEGRPPLVIQHWPRARTWQHAFQRLLVAMAPHAPMATRGVIDALLGADPEDLETMATRALRGADPLRDPVADPLIAAVLQVYWARMAASLSPDGMVVPQPSPLCPVCGSAPVASVVHGSGAHQGVRYLHCSLCESEWQLTRIRCSHCDGEEAISYLRIDGCDAPVRAEVCDQCRSYLKVIHRDHNAAADPVADDLATLGLDVALAAEGYARNGPNLLFVPGEDVRAAN